METRDWQRGCYINRELSWLKFNERVLDEAGNPKVPLAERLNFASIYQTNLDEFYMVRVGILMDQIQSGRAIRENKTNMTSREQVKAILEETRRLEKKKERIYERLMRELELEGVALTDFGRLSKKEAAALEKYFNEEVMPFLSPMIVGKQQPFPFLKGGKMYAIVWLSTKSGKTKMGVVACGSHICSRLIGLPRKPGRFILSEELILHFAPKLFKKYAVGEKAIVRVTRNADMDPATVYDEDLDYRDAVENFVKRRQRLRPVRAELSRKLSGKAIEELVRFLHMKKEQAFFSKIPLDLSFAPQLQDYLRSRDALGSRLKEGGGQREGGSPAKGSPYKKRPLFYERRQPQLPAFFQKKTNMIKQVEEGDVLLSYPFESIRPFLALLRQAAGDRTVVSIKITLYRLAPGSKIVEALAEAAENGKEVLVLLELRARFDEESNIGWSKVLEDAGCRLIYGLEQYKVHSKLCLITRKTRGGLSYITQIGTGNYNENTARLYTDLSLMTAKKEIGSEAAMVFNALSMGEPLEEANCLLVAPRCLQNRILDFIEEEIGYGRRGEPAYIGLKINSLTDKAIMDKLVEASKAGVKVELVIRGICCLVPGLEGETENITVVSIVGRFLEHSRIYRFGLGSREKVYLSSADFMTRNTLRRVEVAVPVYDGKIRERVCHIFDTAMKDDEKGKVQKQSGDYESRSLGAEGLDSQEEFYKEAYEAAGGGQKALGKGMA